MFNDVEDVKEKLIELIDNYDYYFKKMSDYPNSSQTMCREYEQAFLKCVSIKDEINPKERRNKYFWIFIRESFLMGIEFIKNKSRNLIKKISREFI
jgi:hypothetical protein